MQFIIDLMLLSFYAFLTISIFVYIRRFWGMYVGQTHMNKVNADTIILEIKLPREIDKSPLAMEMVLSNLTQGGGIGDWHKRGIGGALPATFSLEIASLEGVIHFYIRTHKKFKELLSASLYAHYPGIEVIEVDDYTATIPRYERHKKPKAGVWGNSYTLEKKYDLVESKSDEELGFFAKYLFFDKPKEKSVDEGVKVPLDAFPMRTYIDLGLDKQKEEMKVDPLVSILEFFGSLGKGEYAALQFIVQDEGVYNDKKFPRLFINEKTHETFSTADIAKKQKEKLRTKVIHKKGEVALNEYGEAKKKRGKDGEDQEDQTYAKDVTEYIPESSLSPELKNQIELIERKLSKPLLACVARCIYVVSPTTKFNGNNVQNVMALFKPFNSPGFNTLGCKAYADPYSYSWQNPNNVRSDWRTEEIFDAFVEREGFHPHTGTVKWLSSDANGADADKYFYKYPAYIRRTVTMVAEAILDPLGHPHADEVFVLNTEELATLFHLPGLVASVPTLPRIDSRKAVAPVNLPV